MKAATKVMEDDPDGRRRGGDHHDQPLRAPRRRRPDGRKTADAGVVDADQQVWSIPNLYVTDGWVLPTQGAVNPALTIMALAARAADRLVAGQRRGVRMEMTS